MPVTETPTGAFWRRLLLLLVVVVGWLALTPMPPVDIDLGWDKLNHFAAFAALAVCAWIGYATLPRRRLFVLVLLLAYGALIELIQIFVPGRSAEWRDLLADAVGILIGIPLGSGGAALLAALALRRAAIARRP